MEASVSAFPISHPEELDLTPEAFRARMRRARERGTPFFPWPDLSPEAWRQSLRAIEGAVAEMLGRDGNGHGNRGDRAPVRLYAPAGSRALGIAAFTSGTGPLLGRWTEDGALASDPDVTRLLLLHLDHGRRRAARLEGRVGRVLDTLHGCGVAPTVLKGFHTAHAFFPEPGARPLSDLDLVVAPDEVPAASRALADAGYRRRPVLRRPYMAEWTVPGESATPRSLELTHEANPWTIDLHATFKRDFGGVRTVSVVPPDVAVTEPLQVGHREVRVLAQPYLAAYLAAHASQELKNLTLVRLVELVWVLRRGSREGSLRWDELEALLRERHAAAYLYPAFELAERLAPGTLPPELRAGLAQATTPRVRAIVARLAPGTAQRLESVALEEQFMWASSPLDHARRIRRALWPSWAGSFPEMIRVQSARLRQFFARRVALHDQGRTPGG